MRWLVLGILAVAAAVAIFSRGLRGPAVAVTVFDDAIVSWLGGIDIPGYFGLMRALSAIGSWWIINAVALALLVALLVFRRIRHLIVVLIGANLTVVLAQNILGPVLQRPRPFGVPIRVGWGGWALPPLQVVCLSALLVVILYTMVPEGRLRNAGKWLATALVALFALARMALGAEGPTDVLLGAAVGVTLLLIAFRIFTPNEIFPINYKRGRSAHLDVGGERGAAIRRGLGDQLGLHVEEVKPFGLAGSAGSTPLRIKLKGEEPSYLFGKLYARGHLRADRWYKLGRELMYGRLEDEKPFNTVRRLVQQEDYALALMQRAGLPSATPFGFVELTPDREYLLVTEFFDGATELGDAEVDEQIIDEGLGIVRKMWDAGLAHRDVKPANLLVRDGRILMIDVAFAEARPSPWRQAIDLANMMLCLALRSSPELVYERALQQFSVEEIGEAFAAARGLALPSQLRHLIRSQGRDLHAEFVKLLPSPPQPISIQRWSWRRVGLVGLLLILALVIGVPMLQSLFNNDLAVKTDLGTKNVSCPHMETQWLLAQSVPTAQEIPCVRELPAGWSVNRVDANAGSSNITLHYDRIGNENDVVARLRFAASCDATGATEITGTEQGVRRSELVQPAPGGRYETIWFDRFAGGCVTTDINVPSEFQQLVTRELPTIVGYNSRQRLRTALTERSDGQLKLDP